MKKIILTVAIFGGLAAVSETANAQTAILKGWTNQSTNSSGGTTTTCPPDPSKICTTNTKNPNGTYSIYIYKYDSSGNLLAVVKYSTKSEPDNRVPDEDNGFIHDIKTTEGIMYGRES